MSPARVALLISLLAIVTHPLPAQAPANRPPAASDSHRVTSSTLECDPFFVWDGDPFFVWGGESPTLLPSPSPSDPGYGSKHEQLLNKLTGVTFIGQIGIGHNKGPICPLSLEAPAPPLPFQITAVPSEKITPSGTSLPKWNYPAPHWATGPYRIYRIHYSIAPKDLKLYSQIRTQVSHSEGTTFSPGGGTYSATQTDRWTTCGGTLEFTTVLYDNDGAIINSTDAMVMMRKIDLTKAKQMLQSGVGLDQVIAVPASGSYRLRAMVTDPASQRGSESQLTVDAANPPH
jgi:hypothetical protein